MSEPSKEIAVAKHDIEFIKQTLQEIKESLKQDYVTKDSFRPVRMIAYGLVGLLGISFMGAIAALVFYR